MKKFVLFLIFLILSAGTVAYFGWVQIPENSYGVFFSTVTGYDKNVLETGNFHFRWQRLIPKNSKTYIIDNALRRRNITISGMLPSGSMFSQVMHGNPDFSYTVSTTVTYSISKDFIMEYFIEKRNISTFDEETGIDNFFAETDRQIQSLLRNYIETRFLISVGDTQNNAPPGFSAEQFREIIRSNIHSIEVSELAILNTRFPDINLYRLASIQYREIADEKRRSLLELELLAATREADLTRRLGALRRYAELLNQFPILLDYFRINPDGDIFRESERFW
ncbi:MAG: hypothetical protein FWD87_09020 [Spirochaetaceae bacterium]|nr:hypothetical protein [Spirochaetaceae bacterium]